MNEIEATTVVTMWVTGAVVTCKACRVKRPVRFDPPAADVDEATLRLAQTLTKCRCKATDAARVRFKLESAGE